MPTQTTVMSAFKLDLHTEESWPLLKEMSKDFGIGLWMENTGLFYLALKELRVDFFINFKSIISKTIRYTNRIPVAVYNKEESIQTLEYKSLLRYAIEIDDLQILQVILECWVENMNKDIEDPLTQRLYHASYMVDPEDVFRLAKDHPSLFITFISNIKLVKTSEILNKSYPKMTIYGKSRQVVASSQQTCRSDMWKHVVDGFMKMRRGQIFLNLFRQPIKEYNEGQQVTSKYLPLVNAASRQMLNAYVDISINEKNVGIFDSDVGRVILKYLWKRHAYISHVQQFMLYLLFVALYSYSIYRFLFLLNYYGPSGRAMAWVVEALLLAFTVFYLLQQFYQVYSEFKDIRNFQKKNGIDKANDNTLFLFHGGFWSTVRDHFLSDIWNVNNLLICVLVITGTIIRITDNTHTTSRGGGGGSSPSYAPTYRPTQFTPTYYPTSMPSMQNTSPVSDSVQARCVYAVATITVYFKILYFLRPFAASGPLGKSLLIIIVYCNFDYLFSVNDSTNRQRYRDLLTNSANDDVFVRSSILDNEREHSAQSLRHFDLEIVCVRIHVHVGTECRSYPVL